MTVTLRVQPRGARIALAPLTYEDRTKYAIARELPGAQWDGVAKCWMMPNTAATRLTLHRVFGKQRDDLHAQLSDVPAVQLWDGAPLDALPWSTPLQPWAHQMRAAGFLQHARRHLGCALLDCGMGTGKTRMVLDDVRMLPPEQRRVLVIAPKAVLGVWQEQAAQHGGPELDVRVLDYPNCNKRVAEACALLQEGRPVVVVMGWSVLQKLDTKQKQQLRAALRGATVVADEVHFAKAPNSLQSKNLAFISTEAAMRIGASGTPLAHSPLDAYAVFRYLDPGVFGGPWTRFRDHYAELGGYQGKAVVGYANLDEMADRMRPFTITITRDVLDLLPSQHNDVHVELPPAVRRIYEQLRTQCVAELQSGTLIAANALSRLLRLAQVTSGSLPAQDGTDRAEHLHNAKEDALTGLLECCDPREPWVVFGRFHADLDAAARAAAAQGRQCFELSGRRHQLDEWKAACRAGAGAVLAAQMQSGGIGVSMVEARYCCYMSVGYSLAEYEQSLARTHRPGQSRSVTYYHVTARNTVDVDIRRALAKRADVLDFVKGALLSGERAA